MAACEASVRDPERGRRSHGEGAEVRPGEEPRLARHEAARRGSVGGSLAALSAWHEALRQGEQSHRLRCVRRDRVRHRRSGPRLRNGLDQQERAPVEGRAARRRSGSHGARDRRGPPPHLPRDEAVHAESVGRVRDEPQEGRQGARADQVDHRLRNLHRAARRHRWPRASVRPLVVSAG